ncbi:MAG: glycosyltransferase family 2 protein [Candidatus Tectimicrobiota bacterium]
MHASSAPSSPKVSIILPTYNRATFLPEAFEAIRTQTYGDWELIIVDDGSTDDSRALLERLMADLAQPVQYIWQQNRGAYGARNTGLGHANGQYIAFYDSDDCWLPHHLQDCVDALDTHQDVSWVYGACRIVDYATGHVVAPTTFYLKTQPRPFMQLHTRRSGRLAIIEDARALHCMILHGFYSGLQNSVVRHEVFKGQQFEADSRNEAEDQLFVIHALARGYTFAYYDAIHVIYRVHDANSSAPGSVRNVERQSRVLRLLIEGYERVLHECDWPPAERQALRRRLHQEYFWKLGYATFWEIGRFRDALQMFRRGLYYWPWDWRCWKTYTLALLRCHVLSRIRA